MRLIALSIIWLTIATPATAQTTLQFKFAEGDVIRQVMTQEMKSVANVQGRAVKTEMNQRTHLEQTIGELAADGSASVRQKIGRVQVSMKMPFGQSFDYDSDGDNENVPAAFGNVIGKLAGTEFRGTLAPTGKMTDVKIPEEFKNILREASGSPFGAASDDDVFQQMMSQSSVAFPDKPVEEGESWTEEIKMKMPLGEMKVDRTSTYRGTNDDGWHVIDLVMLTTLKPGRNPKIKMTLKASQATGTLLFDNSAGRLVKMEFSQDMQMEVTTAGQTFDQEVSIVMKIEADQALESSSSDE